MIKNVKHIALDLGQVILDINPKATWDTFVQANIPDFNRHYKKMLDEQIFEHFETNQISAEEFIERFQQIAPQLSKTFIVEAWNKTLLHFPLRRLQILQQLQLHYDLVLISNTNSIHEEAFNKILQQEHGIPSIGVFFDRVYLSHRLGMRKPDPRIFEFVLNDCAFNPSATLFIDDVKENVDAAASLGIQTIWLEPHMTIEDDIFKNVN
jgi:epoxide hydrolase-like predicted phosphatase